MLFGVGWPSRLLYICPLQLGAYYQWYGLLPQKLGSPFPYLQISLQSFPRLWHPTLVHEVGL